MNGLQSLMPPRQQQPQQARPRPAPAQNNPRMAAAMDVVKNDVPEPLQNLVSESEFAQKAMELLQSAGGQAAMGQAPVNPPTVKQRVDQQAMEGVAGLLSRLAPGMQQRGKQVQRAQARKMLGGGMPAMRAPNMQRMADGGIVGYADGGQPMMGPPEPNLLQRMGQGLKNMGGNMAESSDILREAKAGIGVPYENRAAAIQQVRDEIEAQKQNRDPNFIQRMGQKLMDMGLDVQESNRILKEAYSNIGKTYEEKAKGMAMGGEVKSYQEGMEVELDEDLVASLLTQQPETTGYAGPSAAERRAALSDEAAARAQAREAKRAEQRTRQELAGKGLSGPMINEYLERAAQKRIDAVEPGGIGELKQPQFDTRSPQTGPFPARPTATAFMPEGSSVMGGAGQPTTSETVLNEIMGLEMPEIDVEAAPKSSLRQPVIDAAMARVGVDSEAAKRAEEARVGDLARAAYAMSPEMQAEYDRRKAAVDEYYASQLDPKRQRSQKLNALLAGLATPGGIARSGIAALKGTTAVDDARIAARREQAEEQFGIAKEIGDVERESRTKGFEAGTAAGQSVYERSMAATNQAMQSLSQLATSEETGAREIAFKEFDRAMKALGNQLNFYLQKEKLSADDKNTARAVISDARRTVTSINNTIADLEAQKLAVDEAGAQRIDAIMAGLRSDRADAQGQIDQLLPKLGVTPNQTPATGAGGGSTALPAGFVPD